MKARLIKSLICVAGNLFLAVVAILATIGAAHIIDPDIHDCSGPARQARP